MRLWTPAPIGLTVRLVSKGTAYLVAAVILFGSWAAGPVSGILATLGVGVVYAVSLRLHPRTRHTGLRGCGGSGEHHSPFFPWTHRRDPKCQGGRIIRLGAGLWGSGPIRSEQARVKAARASAKSNRTWR